MKVLISYYQNKKFHQNIYLKSKIILFEYFYLTIHDFKQARLIQQLNSQLNQFGLQLMLYSFCSILSYNLTTHPKNCA